MNIIAQAKRILQHEDESGGLPPELDNSTVAVTLADELVKQWGHVTKHGETIFKAALALGYVHGDYDLVALAEAAKAELQQLRSDNAIMRGKIEVLERHAYPNTGGKPDD